MFASNEIGDVKLEFIRYQYKMNWKFHMFIQNHSLGSISYQSIVIVTPTFLNTTNIR